MAFLNIPSTCTDPMYRYKMPAIITKVEGKGKMIKTLILNMDAVAKALGRSPSYIVRFFGTELGCPSKDDMIISGTHSAATLQSLLDKFIEKYVLCRKCCNPEVQLSVQKGIVSGTCAACGWCGSMENNDRLAEFILKHPPCVDDTDKPKKMDKRERQLARAAAARESAQKLPVGAEFPEDRDAAINASKETRLEVDQKREKKDKKEKHEKKVKKEKEKKEKRKIDQEGSHSGDNADNTTPNDVIDAVIGSIGAFVSRNDPAILSAKEFLEETRSHQLANALDHRACLHVSLESLLGDSLNAEYLRKLQHLWGAVVEDAGMKAPDILDAFGMYLLRHPSEASVSKLSPVLKLLYDEEWVDECGALEYYGDQAQNPLREASIDAAQPFLRWLRESNSESESEDGTGT